MTRLVLDEVRRIDLFPRYAHSLTDLRQATGEDVAQIGHILEEDLLTLSLLPQ